MGRWLMNRSVLVVMAALDERPSSISEISRRVDVTRQGVHKIVKRLRHVGVIEVIGEGARTPSYALTSSDIFLQGAVALRPHTLNWELNLACVRSFTRS